ncbi:MAG: hypothetical protein K9M11_00600 [Candidatus Pacebacteria bacterium]|nr:hypothetical protein [Candidatus Paceibacterota bacterium]
MKTLSTKAIEDLKEALRLEIGEDKSNLLDQNDLQQIGLFLLTLLAEAHKRRTNTHPHQLI